MGSAQRIFQLLTWHLSHEAMFTGSILDLIFTCMPFHGLKIFCYKELEMRTGYIYKTKKSCWHTSSNNFLRNWTNTYSVHPFSYFIIGSWKSVATLSCLKSPIRYKSPWRLLSISHITTANRLPDFHYYIKMLLFSPEHKGIHLAILQVPTNSLTEAPYFHEHCSPGPSSFCRHHHKRMLHIFSVFTPPLFSYQILLQLSIAA